MCEVLIVHASEASAWAEYLKQILAVSCEFLEGSIVLYNVNEKTLLKDQNLFGSCKCIIPLLSSEFLDMQSDPDTLGTFRDLLQPPNKIVAFLCGVSEHEVLTDYFEHWDYWRKLFSEDEPSVYVSTVFECIHDGSVNEPYGQDIHPGNDIQLKEQEISQEHKDEFILPDFPEILPLPEEIPLSGPTERSCLSAPGTSQEEQPCLTIQPDRILCGTCVNIYIIMVKNFDDESGLEVDFLSEQTTPKRVPATLVNGCIVTVQSPDMPAGIVSLTLYKNQSVVCSTTVKYYTEMEDICRYLEKATDPMKFMCQAFDITSNVPESLDNLLAESFNKRMTVNELEVFGISQIAQEYTESRRDIELPTLLHFSAKYGLKKLTSLLMRCPGALQAYSMMNRDGDYPNKLAEKSGFSDLRQFMDEYIKTVDLVKSHMEESQNTPENEIYEDMLTASQNFITDFDNEDIYESMIKLNPEMSLYEDLESVLADSNPEELMLRKFFEAQPGKCSQSPDHKLTNGGLPEMDDDEYHDMGSVSEVYADLEEEEDLYNPCYPDQIYDTVEPHSDSVPEVLNRPPAPIPRPVSRQDPEENTTYISKVFRPKEPVYSVSQQPERNLSPAPVRLVRDRDMSSHYDPFAGMKTPGQRQLISLQERVKVGELTVEEAVQEFKAWQFNQEGRSQSLRFQQENLQRLRESITRRCKDKGTTQLLITAPMQTNVPWGSNKNVNCSVYEPSPRPTQPPPVSRPLQRGTWQTGSTSSTSSSGSHRLSIQSTVSNSSGADGDCEEPPDIPLPPRPTRPTAHTPPILPPPRVPPRPPERNVESTLHERYVSTPPRPVAQMSPQRPMPPPPIPRRTW